jgi:hypothetical protein
LYKNKEQKRYFASGTVDLGSKHTSFSFVGSLSIFVFYIKRQTSGLKMYIRFSHAKNGGVLLLKRRARKRRFREDQISE